MPYLLLFALVAVVVILALAKLFAPSLEPVIGRALQGGELGALLDAIRARPARVRPDLYNRSIRRFWDEYRREEAMPLIRALAEEHDQERIAQYWLEQVQTVEPELAARSFDQGFLAAHYRREVAAACGSAG